MKTLSARITTTALLIGAISTLAAGLIMTSRLESIRKQDSSARLLAESRAVAGMLVDWKPGDPIVRTLARDMGVRITVIDRTGIAVDDSDQDPASLPWQGGYPEVGDALFGDGGVAARSEGQGPYTLHAASPLAGGQLDGGVVRLSLAVDESSRNTGATRLILVLLVIVAGGAAAAIGSRLASSIAHPIAQMMDVVSSVSRGDFSRSVYTDSNDELRSLGNALNEMTAKVGQMLGEAASGKNHLEAVLATMESGVVFIDSHAHVSMVNAAAVRMFDLQEPYLGRPHVEVLRNYRISAGIDRALATHSSMRLEVNVIYPQDRSLEVLLTPLTSGPNGSGVVVVFHDVTELKRLERVRKDLVANVSHELKTPVTSVKGFAETLLDGAISDPAIAREFVEIIHREASRLDMLVRDLVDLSRLESAPVPIDPVPQDLNGPIQASTGKAALRAEQAGVSVRINIPGEPVVCPIDAERIEQVMDNLLDNAIKFTPRGGAIEVSLRVQGDHAVVTVSDTGCGIPADDLPRVFERFYTVDKARSKKAGGTGLGLSIVKHTVDLHGGHVWVESQYGRGSSFHFSIPLFSGRIPDDIHLFTQS